MPHANPWFAEVATGLQKLVLYFDVLAHPGDSPVILDTEHKRPAVGVGERDQMSSEIPRGDPSALAVEKLTLGLLKKCPELFVHHLASIALSVHYQQGDRENVPSNAR
jgi:hypothetical protein